ncbi:MAG: hypothetical protein R3F65_19640 [bacterium]
MRPRVRAGRYTLYTGPALGGRNDAVALAVYDRPRRRHRWLMVTRGCVNGTYLHIVAHDDRYVLAYTESRHGRYAENDAPLLLDLHAGVARRIWTRCPEYADDPPTVPHADGLRHRCVDADPIDISLADARARAEATR